MRASRGRVSPGAGVPTALVETTGARIGAARANTVIHFHDGECAVIARA